MPYEIKFDKPPAGYCLTAARSEETVAVQAFEFTSTEDGQHFIQRVEGFPDELLRMVTKEISPSQVDHLLAVIRHDGSATVYVNELQLTSTIRPSRAIVKGERLTKDDIVEVGGLDVGVAIRPDVGFLFLFSVGWRKGLIYDFSPLILDRKPRSANCVSWFGQAYSYLLFQERFSLSDVDWDALFKAKWFPFAALSNRTIDDTIGHIRAGWGLSETISRVVNELEERVPRMLECWRTHPSFLPHVDILSRAVERYLSKDYVSCTALIYPRIEGILRTHHSSKGLPTKPSQGNLAKTAVAAKIEDERCLLLPHRFEAYLQDVFFAGFSPAASVIDVSRHSVAHGVASAAAFNEASAVIGLLVVHQLFYFLERSQKSSSLSRRDSTPQPGVAERTPGQ